jgi:hypothetical protein
MRLVVRFLGLDLLDVDLTTDAAEEDTARDLSGGLLACERIEAGTTDRYLGFTGGWEGDGE